MKYLVCFIRNINFISTWIINNRLVILLIGVFYCRRYSNNTVGDELKQPTRFLEIRHVGPTKNHHTAFGRQLFALGHLAQTFPHKKLCVIHIRMETFSGIHCVGCTYGRKRLGLVASPNRTRAYFSPRVWPDGFWVMWEGPPLSHTLTRRRFKTPSWKGGKNCLYNTSMH